MPNLPPALRAHADAVDPSGAAAEAVARRLAYRRRRGGKWCPICGLHKALNAFGPDAFRPDALASKCRLCDAARNRANPSFPAPFTSAEE